MFRRILFLTFVPFALLVGGDAASAETCGLLAPCPAAPPAPPAEPQPPAPPAPPTPAPAPSPEQRLLELMNRDRADAGAPPLASRDDVAGVAEEHSGRMASEGRIWHNDEYFSAESRRRFGAKTVGENVALNKSIDDAHRRLMNSPGHRANILNAKFTEVGVGVVKDVNGDHFITEAFVEPNAARPAPAAPKAAAPTSAGGRTATPAAAPRPTSGGARTTARSATTAAASTPTTAAEVAEQTVADVPTEVGKEPQVLGRISSDEGERPSSTLAASLVDTRSASGVPMAAIAAVLMLLAALAALVRSARSRPVLVPAFAASTRAA